MNRTLLNLSLKCLAGLFIICGGSHSIASDLGLFSAGQTGAVPPEGWAVQFHPDIPKHSELSLEIEDSEPLLKLKSEAGYGSWVHAFEPAAEVSHLGWAWRVKQAPHGANLKQKSGDDAAAKVCVFIDIDESRLGLGTRLALGAARTLSGENLPSATLCYVWSVQPYQGQLFENPYTDRVRNLVLRDAPAGPDWLTQRRDVRADAVAAFGDELPLEAGQPRVRLLGLALGADADNTKSTSLAAIKSLRVELLSNK